MFGVPSQLIGGGRIMALCVLAGVQNRLPRVQAGLRPQMVCQDWLTALTDEAALPCEHALKIPELRYLILNLLDCQNEGTASERASP